MPEDDYRLLPNLRERIRHVPPRQVGEVARPEPLVELPPPPPARRLVLDPRPFGRRRPR